MKKFFLGLGFIFLLVSCADHRKEVDLLVLGAVIYSMDQDSSRYTAMAVDDGKIVELGTEKNILKKYKCKNPIQLDGKFIYPGLIDAHSHFYGLGQSKLSVDLRGTRSEEEMIKRVQNFYSLEKPSTGAELPSSIQGRGWDQNLWESKKFPTNTQLNQLYPNVPVCLTRIDGHAALVNQKALDLAGINEDTKIQGGEFVKENGRLTGVLIDNAVDLVTARLPQPSKAEKKNRILKAQEICLSYGLTTVCDAGIDKELMDLYAEMHQSGELLIRIYAMANPTQPTLDWLLKNGPLKTEKLHVQSVKYYMDGAMGSRGACLLEDYTDQPGHKGFLLNPIDSLQALALRIKAKGLQLNVHCIGDSANRVTLATMAEVLGTDTASRWRIEHVQLISPQDFKYMQKYHIIPSMQPTHAESDFPWVIERIGVDRFQYAYTFNTCLRLSGIIALGTDFPVEEVNPFATFVAAIKKRTGQWQRPERPSSNGLTLNTKLTREKKEELSRYQALQGMTIWAAYAQFEEKEKGSLEPGKLADFMVLDQDLFTVEENEIKVLMPFQVYINGKLVAGKK